MASHTISPQETNTYRMLVERVASSRYLNKSVRLHDLLMYVCNRVLNEGAEEIGEQEVGCNVFGRPRDYDTSADNIARVHASLLRKRLEQYFAEEGRAEPVIIEIAKGNYAPVFRKRSLQDLPVPLPVVVPSPGPAPSVSRLLGRRSWALAALAAALGCLSTLAVLHFIRPTPPDVAAIAKAQRTGLQERLMAPTVRQFWSQLLAPEGSGATDVVLDDSALELYQQMLQRPVSLEDYLDGNYMHQAERMPRIAKVDRDFAESMALKRSSSVATVQFLWTIARMSQLFSAHTVVQFPKEYSRKRLEMYHAILLGNGNSDPWIQLFDPQLGLRWKYDRDSGGYYPVDTWATGTAQEQYRLPKQDGNPEESYAIVAFLPNPQKRHDVLIISAMSPRDYSAAGDFLTFENYMWQLRWELLGNAQRVDKSHFPYFEALLRITRRPMSPPDISVVLHRSPRLS